MDIGKQHESLQSSSQPQSHSSPGSTTPLPQIACCGSVKHPLGLRAFEFNTGSMDFNEHAENLLLFFLSPDVARANIIKLPSSPPGVHCSGSCYKIFVRNIVLSLILDLYMLVNENS